MDKDTKRILGLITFGIVLFVGLSHIDRVLSLIGKVVSVIAPIGIGMLLAFILNVPVSGYEKLLGRLFAGRRGVGDRAINLLSILLAFISIVLAIVLVCTMVIPQFVISIKSLYNLVVEQWPTWMELLRTSDFGSVEFLEDLEKLDIKQYMEQVIYGAGNILDLLAGTMSSVVSGFTTFMLSLVISIYVLISKKSLSRQVKKLLYAYLKKNHADQICRVASLVQSTYGNFLSGQCVEAIILGTLIFIAFSIFRLPYAGLIAVLTAFCAFIPYVGAFISCVIGAFLTFLTNPMQAVICIVVYLCVQFVENQFIYPRVVGNSVGLSPLWTIIALIVGGNLFGLLGMLFFIPLTSVVYTLIREMTDCRLENLKAAQ